MDKQGAIVGSILVILIISLFYLLSSRNAQLPSDVNTESSSINLVESPVPTTAEQTTMKNGKKVYRTAPGVLPIAELENKKVVIKTIKGEIIFQIFTEAPKAASNFIFLTKQGFYDGLTFHRVEPGFVIQGGDPVGNGTGGPGYQFEDEPVKRAYDKGIVAMANAGPNTNGSQFFIMLEDTPLPPNYTIFGKVLEGQDVIQQIQVGDVMEKVSIEGL